MRRFGHSPLILCKTELNMQSWFYGDYSLLDKKIGGLRRPNKGEEKKEEIKNAVSCLTILCYHILTGK